ncbi:hypothetical protein FOZ61_009827 [Perkinsus olseni]|uniref:Uncharacterized protein n=1 Tax=Perkinsus olseni TaxID=32597 RepID=A0A7J6L0M2_PEROL|nr:hypothetical protein FOZ61_009827 [Perkinsus olseni]
MASSSFHSPSLQLPPVVAHNRSTALRIASNKQQQRQGGGRVEDISNKYGIRMDADKPPPPGNEGMARRRPLRKLADAVVIAPSQHDNSITHVTPVEQQQHDDGKVIDEGPPSSHMLTHHHADGHHADGHHAESITHQHAHEEVSLYVGNNLSEDDVPKEVLPLLSTPVGISKRIETISVMDKLPLSRDTRV